CSIDAVVQNGVWIRQEPVFDSPLNLGAHCAKGASIREHGITHDSHRLKYPMKLEGGKWKKVSWDQAYDDISKKLLEIRNAKENGCKVIVADPRFTRTAAKADMYVRTRSGADVPFLFGILHHVFKNGWEDKEYIKARVHGMDEVKKEVMAKWTPDKVTEACGVPEDQVFAVAKTLAENRPGFIIWAMGQTQHTNANAIVRASNILMLALGNVGRSGGGCNIYRGHDNVQGATDIGPNPDTLPGYYPVAVPGSWAHWAKVWNVDPAWLKGRYASEALMAKPGMTVSRWIDGVMEKNDAIDQDPNLRAIFFWGHAPNSQTRGLEMLEAMKKLDLMVVIDPYPSASAAMFAKVRKDGAYLLPAATQLETE